MKKLLALSTIIFLLSCKRESTTEQLQDDELTIADSITALPKLLEAEEPKFADFCDTLTKIDEKTFIINRTSATAIKPNPLFKKKNGIIKVPDTEITFKDDLNPQTYQEYVPLGKLTSEIYIVSEQDYHQNYYHVINSRTKSIYHFAGPAQLYGNMFLSIEDEHTDGNGMIELWEMKSDTIVLKRKFSLNGCGISYFPKSYISNEHIYLKGMYRTDIFHYYRIKI